MNIAKSWLLVKFFFAKRCDIMWQEFCTYFSTFMIIILQIFASKLVKMFTTFVQLNFARCMMSCGFVRQSKRALTGPQKELTVASLVRRWRQPEVQLGEACTFWLIFSLFWTNPGLVKSLLAPTNPQPAFIGMPNVFQCLVFRNVLSF